MHSSSMRASAAVAAGRGVYPSMHWVGGVFPHGVSAGGVCLPEGCLPRHGGCLPGGCLPRGVSAPVHAGIHTPHGQDS